MTHTTTSTSVTLNLPGGRCPGGMMLRSFAMHTPGPGTRVPGGLNVLHVYPGTPGTETITVGPGYPGHPGYR
eukprot:2262493-Rhodomonas_salina.3